MTFTKSDYDRGWEVGQKDWSKPPSIPKDASHEWARGYVQSRAQAKRSREIDDVLSRRPSATSNHQGSLL